MITQDELQGLIYYDPTTGKCTWKKQIHRGHHKIGDNVGHVHKNRGINYYRCTIYGNRYMVHILVYLFMTGRFPEGKIDHIDGNGLNNRWDNLRDVSNAVNGRNCSMNCNNNSGHNGISRFRNKWRVRFKLNYKEYHVGVFDNLGDAIAARDRAYTSVRFHPNHGRPKK